MLQATLDTLPFSCIVWREHGSDFLDCTVEAFNAGAVKLLLPAMGQEMRVGARLGDLFPEPHAASAQAILDSIAQDREIITTWDFGPDYVVPGFYRLTATPVPGFSGCSRVMFEEVTEVEFQKERFKAESQAQQHLLAYLSHDLREPTRNAALLVDLARGEKDAERVAKYLDKATGAIEKCQRLIDGLNVYRQLSTLAINGPISAQECFDEARAHVSGLDVSGAVVDVIEELPMVKSNRLALVTIFRNILANAVKYSLPDEPPRITVYAKPNGTNWRITVADQGVGFDPRHADRIFKPGERLERSDGVWGDGIGLANCAAAATSQGGTITAESPGPNCGAAFTVTLPSAENPLR